MKETIVGLDLANGFIKVASKENKLCYENKVRTLPRNYEGHIFGDYKETVYTFNGERYVLDPISGKSSGSRNSTRYETEQYLLECLIAITKVTSNDEISLVVGLPGKDYYNKEVHKMIEKNLVGDHKIKVGDKTRIIEIKDIEILNEPFGTLIDLLVDEKYNVVDELLDLTYLVIDIGYGTTDILEARGLEVLNVKHAQVGTMTLINKYLERINETYGDTNTSFDKSNIGMKPTSVIKKYNKIFDCSSELDKAKKVFVTELNDALNGEEVDFRKHDRVLFTGGGSLELDGYITIPENAYVYEGCQMGNVLGYLKYGYIMKG